MKQARTTTSTALARRGQSSASQPIRMLRLDLGGEVPAVVQVLPGETDAHALHRLDRGYAAKARAQGLGFLICDVCDRPTYVCRRDSATCAVRRAHARGGRS